MGALSEEHAGRTVELRHDNTFRAVDHERTLLGHVRNQTEINVLDHRSEIFVVRVGAVEFKFGFEGHTIGHASFETFIDRIAGRIDIIVEKFQHEVIAGVGNREVLGKYFKKALIVAFFRGSVELEEVAERLELHFQKVGIRKRILNRRKIYAGFSFCY